MGTADLPFNPLALALGANGTFIARTLDRDPKHQQEMYRRAYQHKGTSLVEIYQNCNVFNDGAFEIMTEKGSKAMHTIFVEDFGLQKITLVFFTFNREAVFIRREFFNATDRVVIIQVCTNGLIILNYSFTD